MGNFNTHVDKDSLTWTGIIGVNGLLDLNLGDVPLLDTLSITGDVFKHKDPPIDFIIVLSALRPNLLDTRVRREAI